MRVLVAGWFSFEEMGATAGDIMACNVACNWLEKAGADFDVAYAPPFTGGVKWEDTSAVDYSHVLFVCGPFGNGWPITGFLEHFAGCKLIGLNLSMLQNIHEWNPFDILFERDSDQVVRPDISMLSAAPKVPVAGLILAHLQKEYGKRSKHPVANQLFRQLIDKNELAVVPIDTVIAKNEHGLRTPAEIESLIAKMDIVLTTRLHGTVLALKNGVPPIVIDPVEGGAKISGQVKAIGWPLILPVESVNYESLYNAYVYAQTNEARREAIACRDRAVKILHEIEQQFLEALVGQPVINE
ncbi:polysaccharide pyruvyl transferase family protein [Flavihumibacter stibioxidans]|uniref:Polysaccharide pyruvyl transferase domain-containing protein n=1 Tax=Flavihumibacter stibioxidans TaxID=1834163 RepID=A0ABR7M9L1_9BACT|nr:polysaccharide pyruvyl transferase family protein [Flavihumibacter stibioxidans]MBC6491727.1 hypothetical protein [Flavihumibacter stibioxidans]